MITVAVLIPSTGRAAQLEERVSKLLRQTPPRDVCMAVVLAIPVDDAETLEAAGRLQAGVMHKQAELHVVERARNVSAVEGWLAAFEYAAYNGADWFVLGADDIEWGDNWLYHALQTASATTAQVIGLNDGGHTDLRDYAPHYMMARQYAEWHGFMPEVYQSWWFDRDVCHAAQLRGQYAASPHALAIHHHPDWGAPMDATYQAAWPLHDVDKAVYERRRLNGFRS